MFIRASRRVFAKSSSTLIRLNSSIKQVRLVKIVCTVYMLDVE